ncbi:MAG: nucleoside hydrolase [Candidatus Helarchaeota archaeon]
MIDCIIDTDPGIDDALAIIFALRSKLCNVKAITTVFGNSSVENTALNALKILDLIGIESVPVAKGCSEPIIKYLKFPKYNYTDNNLNPHGSNGLADVELPRGKLQLKASHAIDLLINTILENPNRITLVSIAPLTNLAMAFLKSPEIIPILKDIIIMGGAIEVPGNITPFAEFNIWADAEAAKIVFSKAASKITLVPLDVTTKIILTEIEWFDQPDGYHQFLYQTIRHYQKFHERINRLSGCYLHDPFAIGIAMDRTLAKINELAVDIEITALKEYGRTYKVSENSAITKMKICLDVAPKSIKRFRESFLTLLI